MNNTEHRIVLSRKRIVMAIIINAIIIGIMIILSLYIYRYMIKVEQENCFDTLEDAASGIEDQISNKVQDNINILKLISNSMVVENRVHATTDNLDAVNSHLKDFQKMTIFNRIDILYADGTLLLQSEGIRKTDYAFEDLTSLGLHVSDRVTDILTGKECILCAVPILRDDQTVAILLGVIMCEDFPKYFNYKMYDGHAILCLLDRSTGEFIMDDWHDTLGSIQEYKKRKTLSGYEHIDVRDEVLNGKTGVIAYESMMNGKASYMYYTLIDDLDWEMLVVAQEDVVFYRMYIIRRLLIYLAIMESVLLISYLIWTILILNNALKSNEEFEKQSYIDSLTGIYNRNKFNQTVKEYEFMNFSGLGVVFLDLNNLKYVNDHQGHNAGDKLLKQTATIMTKFFGAAAYRIGGDEFVVCASNFDEQSFYKLTDSMKAEMQKEKVDIAMGITWRVDNSSLKDQIQEADMLMYQDKQKQKTK